MINVDLYCTLHHVRIETSHLEQKPQEISKKLLITPLENLSPLPTYPLPSHSFRPSFLLITSNFSHFLHASVGLLRILISQSREATSSLVSLGGTGVAVLGEIIV